MNVVVNKLALEEAIEKILLERSIQSTRIDTIAGQEAAGENESAEPIEPSELMATQFATEMPPVGDPEFIPASNNELSKSASVIAREVPDDQMEYFYRKLHDLLDDTLDKHAEAVYGEDPTIGLPKWLPVAESIFRKKISLILEADINTPSSDGPFGTENDDTIIDLVTAVLDFELDVRERWISAGVFSDERSGMEETHPYIFDSSGAVSSIDKVAEILSLPQLSQALQDAVKATGSREETLKLLAGRHYDKNFARSHVPSKPYSADQINVNQELAKDLDKLLPEKTYKEIIQHYENLKTSESDPLLLKGYDDMIAIIHGRIYDEKKRERTDLSAKIMKSAAPVVVPDAPTAAAVEEERLKKLDALAPFFGFKNASGIRQWRRKYAEPKFKAMLGSINGIDAYKGYADKVLDNMSALLDEFAIISENSLSNLDAAIEKSPDDAELKSLRDGLTHINDQFQDMLQQSLSDEDGQIPIDLLTTTAGGYMLRSAFSEAYFNKQFRDFANDIKKHMILFLGSLGASPGISGTFAKMFNGEVDLVPLNSDKRQAEKLRQGGITQDIYNSAVRESESFTKDFFTGDYQKQSDQRYLSQLGNKKYIKKLFQDSIDMAIDEMDLDTRLDKELSSTETGDEFTLSESGMRAIISSILGENHESIRLP